MIHHNSSLSNPIPLSEGTPASATRPSALPAPSEKMESSAVQFTGTGSEYFRIWIVNLLLILVTLGLYIPWAKVRKLKYFYNNTHLDGHALEFHGEPKKMLRGTLIGGVLFAIYNVAAGFSAVAGLIALAILMGIAPLLFRAAMKFRLANTSWRGIRMRFVAQDLKGVYGVFLPPVILLSLGGATLGVMGELGKDKSATLPAALVGVVLLLMFGCLPYFFWRLKSYQHNNYAWGPLRAEYRSKVGATYKVFGLTLLLMIVIGLCFAAIVWFVNINEPAHLRQPSGQWALLMQTVLLMLIFFVLINILPRAYFTVRMQNLLWSRTGNRYFRFKSELAAPRFIGLQVKNYLLIATTVGLYWPFAVINTMRMRLEAVSLKTRIPLDKLTDAARSRENDAAGDMAADIFGFDVGM